MSIFQKKFHACPHSSSSLSCVPFPIFFFHPHFFLFFFFSHSLTCFPQTHPSQNLDSIKQKWSFASSSSFFLLVLPCFFFWFPFFLISHNFLKNWRMEREKINLWKLFFTLCLSCFCLFFLFIFLSMRWVLEFCLLQHV